MRKSSQKGFSIIEILIVIIIIVGIVTAGWLVWSGNQDNKKQPSNSNTQTTQTPPKPDPSEGGKYLVIKEWDIRFQLPEELRGDISYFMNDLAYKASGGPILVDLVSKEFSAGLLKCGVIENRPRSLLSIERQIDDSGGETVEPQPFKRLDKTRYYYLVTGCEEAINREDSTQDKQLLTRLKEAVTDTLEAYKF